MNVIGMRLILTIILGLQFCAFPASAVTLKKHVVKERSIDLPVYIYLPDRITGKIPAMLLVHGSGGLNLKAKEIYTSAFAAKGVATIFIDSFTPRGVKTTTEDQSAVDPIDMGKDALAALKYVADNVKEIDAANVGIMGFSKGGGVVVNMSLTVFNKNPSALRFVRFIAMYPPCNGRRLNPKTIGPLTIIVGEDDTYNLPGPCEEMAADLQQAGSQIAFRKIPGAQHAWDVLGPAHVVRTGENYSNCRFEEVQPQVWVETHSKIKVFDHGKVATRKLALDKCLTRKVSWGYSAKATSISMKYVGEEIEKLTARR
jgi:dienelactone hydrolase